MIGKTKLGTILFFSIMLLGTNFISAASFSFENSSTSTDVEKNYYSFGAYPLEDEVVPSMPPEDTHDTPEHFDWRNVEYEGQIGNWLTSIKTQGPCGSCWAQAAIGTIEAMVNIQRDNPDIDLDLSEQQLVSCCNIGCNGCHGGNSYYAWEYLMDNNGAILESYFPYEGIDFNGCNNWQNEDCSEDPITCDMKSDDWDNFTVPIKSIGYYDNADFSLIKDTLVNVGPVVTYMLVYSDFINYLGGIYEKNKNAELAGGHAVMIVGYDEKEDYLICKNSWGKIWGEKGYFRIRYAWRGNLFC
jgi:C1A family cysteine protease